MAVYYHQHVTSPCIWTGAYPAAMNWDAEFLAHVGHTRGLGMRHAIKKRKVGFFIGLRGCETPVEEREMFEGFLRERQRVEIKGGDGVGFWGRDGFGRW